MATHEVRRHQRFGALAVLAIVAAVLAVWSLPTQACPTAGTVETVITIQASNGQDTGEVKWVLTPDQTSGDRYGWSLSAPVTIRGASGALGTIMALGLEVDTDPEVKLNFVAQALDTDATFTVLSSTVTFAPLTNPLAYATAAITLTDGDGNGASLTGQFDGGKAYEARYNSPATVWAGLLGSLTTPSDMSSVDVGRRPSSGNEVIPDTVSSIQSEFKFTLSANDQASGTSRFQVLVPEPATLALLTMGGLAILLGRRRK